MMKNFDFILVKLMVSNRVVKLTWSHLYFCDLGARNAAFLCLSFAV